MNEIVSLASELIRIPSRAGKDRPDAIVEFLAKWLRVQGLEPKILCNKNKSVVGLYLYLPSDASDRTICLDACLDTADFGNESLWKHSPVSGQIDNDRLFGRGAADCKIAVSIFAYLACEVAQNPKMYPGGLYFLFDADEHTGQFGGAKAFLQDLGNPPTAAVIGYPGNYGIVVGARGFYRAILRTSGVASHSGSGSTQGVNAIFRMARLINLIEGTPLPPEQDAEFKFGPKVSVTEVGGGFGFSQVPDTCDCKVDFRLTPAVHAQLAEEWLRSLVQRFDNENPGPRPTVIEAQESWPAYRLPTATPLVRSFAEAGKEVFGRELPEVVCGPSNIGNFFATRGIPAICGFGVSYGNTHATEEYVELASIAPVFRTYRLAIQRYFAHGK